MITRPTVLILGAGASQPYGFPPGRELVFTVISHLQSGDDSSLRRPLREMGFTEATMSEFRDELLLSNQPSVDAFLESRPEFIPVGKAAIAVELIARETPDALVRRPDMRWYEYLFNQIGTTRDDFLSCPLRIVTFNYDRSLEYALHRTVKSAFALTDAQAAEIVRSFSVTHVHGTVGPPHFLDINGRPYTNSTAQGNIALAVQHIRIVHELDAKTPEFEIARSLIGQAQVLAFIGFGYHPTNLKRLRIDSNYKGRTILGSAYHLAEAEMHRVRASFPRPHSIELGHPVDDCLEFLRNSPVFL